MGAHTYRELTTWRLADDPRRQIIAITTTKRSEVDRRFCDSFRETASSVCRNLAEGFGRFTQAEFAHFTRIALGSLNELQDHLEEASARGLLQTTDFDRLWGLSEHAKASATSLLRWLSAPTPGARHRRRR